MCSDTGKGNLANVIRVGKAAAPFLQVTELQRWESPNPSTLCCSMGSWGALCPHQCIPIAGGGNLRSFFPFSPSHSCNFSPISHPCFACAIILNKFHAFAIIALSPLMMPNPKCWSQRLCHKILLLFLLSGNFAAIAVDFSFSSQTFLSVAELILKMQICP